MWADDATIELLSYVSQGSHYQPILIISAYRDAEVDAESSLAKYVYQEKRDKRLKEMQLKALSKRAVAAIIESILGKERSSSEFTESIFAKTGGNPFFVEELSRSLAQQFRLIESTGPINILDLQIPTTVKTVIRQRLSKLTPGTFQTLTTAAMIGREFTFDLLRDVTETSENTLLDQLEEALRARILRESKIGQVESFQFLDAPVHEYLVHEISLVRRRRYHKRIADLIEEKHPHLVRMQPERIAYHYLHSGDNQKALKYTILGAENAQRFYAHDEARKLYQQALDLVENDPKLEAELLESMAVTSYFASNPQSEDFERAIKAMRKLNLPKRVAALYDLYSIWAWQHDASVDEARELCLRGLSELGDDTRNAEAAGLHAGIARIYALSGRPSDAIEWAEKAAKIAEEARASEVLAQVYQTLAISLPLREKERILKLLQDAIKISRDNELYDPLCRAHVNLGYTIALLKNDFEKAIEIYREGLDKATRRGMLGYRLHLSSELAYYCYIPTGRYDEAKTIAEENLRLAGNWKFYQVYPRLILGHVSMAQGDYSKARASLEETLPISRETGWSTLISDNLRELGILALETNDIPAAEKYLNEANEYLQKMDDTTAVFRAEILFYLGRTFLLRNDLSRATQLVEQIEEFSTMIQENWVLGFQAELAGHIAQKKGDADEATRKLNDALTIWERTKREPDANRVKTALRALSLK
jgi:tetratricopeptide (TPR) repeat protein